MLVCERVAFADSDSRGTGWGTTHHFRVRLRLVASPRLATEAGPPTSIGWIGWHRIAEEHGVFVVVTHLVGFEEEGVCWRSVLVNPRGQAMVHAPLFGPLPSRLSSTSRRSPEPGQRRRAIRPQASAAAPAGIVGGRAGRRKADGDEPETPSVKDAIVAPSRKVSPPPRPVDSLAIDPGLTRRWLVEFIRDEVQRRRRFSKVVIGLSGGVDSALVAFLAAEALGKENVTAVFMPYRTSSPDSLEHAELVIDQLGIRSRTVDISAAVDGLVAAIGGDSSPSRKGNIMARMRMITLFDLSAELDALPLGTGNKTERLLGYFTWHADDSPPVNPIGDLFKTQVWALARFVRVPEVIVTKPAAPI